jgi:AcrR family transcriptional regulator
VPRAGLRRDVLAAAAADIADESGYEQLTLAAVATRFGVRQPSLYKHVRSLAELRRDIAVLAGRELHAELSRATVGRSGTEALLTMADAYRRFALDHPGRYAASVIAPAAGDTEHLGVAADILHTVSAVLGGYRLHGDDEVHAIRALRSLMHGFVSLQVAGGFALSQDLDESYHRMVAGFARSLEHTAEDAAVPVSPAR